MLLLHGYLSCKESFYYQIEYLSKYYRVTAPDLPGFGKSAPPESAYSVGDYSRWLERFLREAKIVRPHIVAHSFGARVAFRFLSERPDACGKLVITGGAGLVKPRSPQYIRKVKAYRRIKKLFPRFAERHFGSAEYRALSPLMKESYKKIVNEDLSDCAARIRNKTLLIYGREDTVTPPNEEGETFHRLIADSRLEIIEGGHFCFSQCYGQFNRMVYDFLKG